ncbi:MAG: S8 family serine peptidase [Thermoleophilia bacterium]|nr:S8 family serine peptidase [Thermoleophilia bacterium]
MSRRLRPPAGPWVACAGLVALGVAAAAAPVIAAEPVPSGGPGADARLIAAGAWHDVLDAWRTPPLPAPGGTESAVVLLSAPAAADAPPARRAAAAAAVDREQREVEATLRGIGAVVTFRYRVLVNGIGVRVPAGRLAAVAEIPQVTAVVPVGYLAPAAAAQADPAVQSAPAATAPAPLPAPEPTDPATRAGDGGGAGEPPPQAPPSAGEPPPPAAPAPAPVPPAGVDPAHVALIDAGVDVSHPWLGGGIGPTFPVVGGADLVDGDSDPAPDPAAPEAEAHGTQMASIILRSPALAGLAPERVPRLLAYRVVAREVVEGRVRALARTDRVLAALEAAMDPDGDGDPADGAEVLVVGLARGFDGGGVDPLARALRAADRAGAVVVVPAGNDGPTNGHSGSVGGPAAGSAVLTVGGLAGATTPRQADLEVAIGPASARLGPLPLLGAEPDPAAGVLPIVLVPGPGGVGQGGELGEFLAPDGQSLVRGALAVVGRGAPIAEVARRAAAAGAAGLAVWDRAGGGAFPGIAGGAEWPIPVVGLGARQGQALADLVAAQPGLGARVTPLATAPAPAAVASFSSRGPTADGRLKPDLVAPGVDVESAYPGADAQGLPRTSRLTGTSAAAAAVAAMALRVRVDRPDLRPADVRSVLVQAAAPVPGVAPVDQGAGAVPDPAGVAGLAVPPVAVDPPIVTQTRPRAGREVIGFAVRDLTGEGGAYRVLFQGPSGATLALGPPVRIPPGVRAGVRLAIPAPGDPGAAFRGRVLVVLEGASVASATAPVWAAPAAPTPASALGRPRVRVTGSGLAEVRVRVGTLTRTPGRIESVALHDVGLWLVPQGEGAGEPMRMGTAKQAADWPAARYRFLLARRQADGEAVPEGRYRVRVTAAGPDGAAIARVSAPFTLGPEG